MNRRTKLKLDTIAAWAILLFAFLVIVLGVFGYGSLFDEHSKDCLCRFCETQYAAEWQADQGEGAQR